MKEGTERTRACSAAAMIASFSYGSASVRWVRQSPGNPPIPGLPARAPVCGWVTSTSRLAEGNPAEAARDSSRRSGYAEASLLRATRRSRGPLLAEAHLAQGDRKQRLLELEPARTSFDRLGARIDLEQVTERIAATKNVNGAFSTTPRDSNHDSLTKSSDSEVIARQTHSARAGGLPAAVRSCSLTEACLGRDRSNDA